MNNINCCEKYDLGVFLHNEDKEFSEIVAADTGEFTFRLFYMGVSTDIKKDFVNGETLFIPKAEELNEDYTYYMQILKPDGSLFSYNDYTCFKFVTIINVVACDNAICDTPYSS